MFDVTARTARALQTAVDFLTKMYPEDKFFITWLRNINPKFGGSSCTTMLSFEFWENGNKEKIITFVFWFESWLPDQLHRLQIVKYNSEKTHYKPDDNFELVETTEEDL